VPIYYDALISKLVASGTDRAQAVARMRRALAEYDVRGIRTTVPFFRWLLDQRLFLDAAFHTAFLDTLLQQRRGTPFLGPNSSLREVALIAAAIYVSRVPRAESVLNPIAPSSEATGVWARQAKVESLRA
jgi:acetyl/propionyl-CoA carboxylase alpha subunit